MAARTLARVTTPHRLPSRAAAARLARRVAAGEPALGRARRVGRMLRELAETHPDAHCELDFTTPLRAGRGDDPVGAEHGQAGQRGHPEALRPLPTAADYAAADRAELEELIQPTGFFRNKATH